MITVKKLHSYNFIFLAAVITVLLVLPILTLDIHIQSLVSRSNTAPVIQTPPDNDMYLVIQGWDDMNSVLAFDQSSGEVSKRFDVGYNAAVKLTTDKRFLYSYNQSLDGDEAGGVVSAIDTSANTMLWKVNIPGIPFVGHPGVGAWLSTEENLLYLQGSPDGLFPHIYVVDTQTGGLLHDYEIPLPYPSNVDQAFPLAWKPSWAEMLVVVSRDQLFSLDLSSGQASNPIPLFDSESVNRVPVNLPHTAFVWNGALDPDTQQLFLATSTQEILSVDLNTQPFTLKPVAALPSEWQFAVLQSFLVHPQRRTVYTQVKREDTPIIDGLEAEEVWGYDIATWEQKDSLNIIDQFANAPKPAENGSDLTNYGLVLSADGQSVYSLTSRGILKIDQDDSGNLNGTWLNVEGLDTEFASIFVVP